MDDDIRKEVFFKFVVDLGWAAALNMDNQSFDAMNQVAIGLLQQVGMYDEFLKFSREMKIPMEHRMTVGRC